MIKKIISPDEKSKVCDKILRSLPKWFGIESSIVDYVQDVATMETWASYSNNELCGFISINKHNTATAEIHVIGVIESFHKQGIGKLLIHEAEKYLAEQNFKYLTVKTLSELRADENYEKTRHFYLAMGFSPVEVFKTLWGEHNPCLLMIKNIESSKELSFYNPTRFKNEDLKAKLNFIKKHPFATVISNINSQLYISHLPLVAVNEDNQIYLYGHLASVNHHSEYLDEQNITVIFNGAHTYVTPKWYTTNDVPTWNYSVLQLNGHVQAISDDTGIIECLKLLTDHSEKLYPSGWDFFIPDDLKSTDLSKYIIGFKIKVHDMSFKQKLSQNRSAEDRDRIIDGLSSRTDENSKNVRLDMMTVGSK